MENKSVTLAAQVLAPAVSEIRSLLEASRKNVAQQVNQELLSTYWKIGEIVVRCEQNDSIRAAYGEKTLSQLSRACLLYTSPAGCKFAGLRKSPAELCLCPESQNLKFTEDGAYRSLCARARI